MEDLADLALQAASVVAGYLAGATKDLADKVRAAAVERLFSLIEPKLRGSATGSTALRKLEEAPADPTRQEIVAALVHDVASVDNAFAQQLVVAVQAATAGAGGFTAQRAGHHVQVSQTRMRNSIVTTGAVDNSKHTIRIGTGGLVLAGILAAALLAGAALTGAGLGGAFDRGATTSPASPTSELNGGGENYPRGLPKLPYETVRMVYDNIAQAIPDHACLRFDNPTRQKFATDFGYSDCQAAATALTKQVTNVNDYAESIPSYISGQSGNTIQIDSCSFTISGGPALGVFTVTKIEAGQWLIVGHEPGPTNCPTKGR